MPGGIVPISGKTIHMSGKTVPISGEIIHIGDKTIPIARLTAPAPALIFGWSLRLAAGAINGDKK
jgi:hypothetical protein